MQLIWTPKLINICGEDTRKLLRPARRPFFGNPPQEVCNDLFFSFLWRGPFAIYLRLIIKQPKAYVLFAHKDENKLVASLAIFQLSTCHLPLSTCHRVELSWAQVEFSYKIYLFRRHDLLPTGVANGKTKRKQVEKVKRKGQKDLSQAGNEVQGIVSSFGNEVTFKV